MSAKVVPFPVPAARDERSDQELMTACSRGDTHALGAVFDRYHDDVHRFVLRMAFYHDADADDLVQTTFMTAHRASAKYDGSSPLRSWLLGVAANVVRHHRRSIMRRSRLKEAAKVVPRAEPLTPESRAGGRQRMQRLEEGIANLNNKHRDVFVLCQIEGVACTDAAKSLGVPVGTIYRRLHEARRELLAWMKRGQR